ncbi:MAG: type II toxin-antitoxin system RelE/ParE family toxin [Fusobacteriaceae bacterium]|nr:type II toxin-antitoxin system RelE/ParE family toxin [Fusobacteriaceae bacterium]
MKVTYKSKKLEKECSDYSLLVKSYGLQIAKKVIQRLNELESSSDLSVMSKIRSARLHKLSGDRSDEYAMDLTGNYRLIITSGDENIKLDQIKIVRIEKIEDYH